MKTALLSLLLLASVELQAEEILPPNVLGIVNDRYVLRPEKTPYDSDSKLRRVYLKAYIHGYVDAVSGKETKPEQKPENASAQEAQGAGLAAGRKAALADAKLRAMKSIRF